MKHPMTAVILAGGSSSRMGENKALLRLGDKRMIQRVLDPLRELFQEVIISTNVPWEYEFLNGVRFIPDLIKVEGKNSLVGIYSTLMTASFSNVFIVACDMPFMNKDLIEHMIMKKSEEDVLIPYIAPHYEPLHAIYNTQCISVIKSYIEDQDYKITRILKQLNVKLIEKDEIIKFDSLMKCFINVNTYEEYLDISKVF